MDVENLRNTYPQLLTYMEHAGYSEAYIRSIQKEVLWILAENNNHDWNDYFDIYKYYEKASTSQSYFRNKRAYLGLIMGYDLQSKLPDAKDSMLIEKGAYTKLEAAFKTLVDYFHENELKRGIEKNTAAVWKNQASCFLLHLQKSGAYRLSDVSEEIALSFFISSDLKLTKGSGYRWTIAHFLKTCMKREPDNCEKVLLFIPMLRKSRKNIQYLTSDEQQKIMDALDDDSNILTLKDRAIGQIAVNYGMRSGDIAALKLASIDWNREIIEIAQRKTKQPLELPLLTVVGNAIYEYIIQERPDCDCPALFIAQNAPLRPVTGEGVWRVSESIMQMLGIRQEKGDRKGFHISRHHLVTTLMSKEVQQPIISAIVGHINPSSLETYSYADHVHLKKCALSIERFPVSWGVLPGA